MEGTLETTFAIASGAVLSIGEMLLNGLLEGPEGPPLLELGVNETGLEAGYCLVELFQELIAPAFQKESIGETGDAMLKGSQKRMSAGIEAAEEILSAPKLLEGLFIVALLKKSMPGIIQLIGNLPFRHSRHQVYCAPRMFLIFVRISMGLKGLTMYSSAPTSFPRSCSATWPFAVSMMT